MDGISLLDASLFYSLLFSPLLTIVLLLFWISANMKNTAKVQLLSIVFLVILGFLAINSPFILIIEATAILLFLVWLYTYRSFFPKEQSSVFLLVFVLQIAYYMLFFFLLSSGNLAITFLCIIPILSMVLLYSWTFGSKNTSSGRVFIIIVFIIQVIVVILTIVLSFIATSNL
ncbi:hypothetical protein [Pradoshia sp.]